MNDTSFKALFAACVVAVASSTPVQGDIAILHCASYVGPAGVYALHSSDGTFAWNYEGDGEYVCNDNSGFPHVEWNGSTVLATCWNGTKAVVDALRIADGQRLWRMKIREDVPSQNGNGMKPVLLDMAANKVFTTDLRHEVLTATELPSSKTLWQRNFSTVVEPLLSETVCLVHLNSHAPGPPPCLEYRRVLLARVGRDPIFGACDQRLMLLDASNGTLYWSMSLLQNNLTDGTIAGIPVVKPNSSHISLAVKDKEGYDVTLLTVDLHVKSNTTEPEWVSTWRAPSTKTYFSGGLVLSGDGYTLLMHMPPFLTAVEAHGDRDDPDGYPPEGYLWSRHADPVGGVPVVDPAGQKAFTLDYSKRSHPGETQSYAVNVYDLNSGNVISGGKFGGQLGGIPRLASFSADGTTVYANWDGGGATVHAAMNTASRQQLWNHTCRRPSGPTVKFV